MSDAATHLNAAVSLKGFHLSPEALGALLALTQKADWVSRMIAADALGSFHTFPEALVALESLAKDPEPVVQSSARAALLLFRIRTAQPAL